MKTFKELINELNPGEMEFSRARSRETSSRHKTSETREKAFVGLFRRVTGKSPTPSQIRNSGAKEGGAKYDETNRELRRKLILTKKINKGYENMRRGKKNPKPYPYGKMADRESNEDFDAPCEDCDCGQISEKSAAWQRKAGKNKEGGLNAAGRRSYERENPGSDLKAPVSAAQAKKSKGGKAAKRRKSFCARMGGMPGPMKDSKGRPTRKALALRKWDC